MSKPKEYSWMNKDKLMTYTFVALLILVGVSALSWGVTSLIIAAIAVLVAVGIDYLLYKVAVDSPLNTMSAAVFGLVVALSYSLGVPSMYSVEVLPLEAPQAYILVVFITAIGLVVFKKLQGLLGRKYVNPAAAAKLVTMIPFLNTLLIISDHLTSGLLQVPSLAGPLGYNPTQTGFADFMKACFSNPTVQQAPDLWWTMIVQKFHGWVGGASSIAVIIVGIGLFVVARRYIKWRITLSYLVTVTAMALLFTAAYGGDALIRIAFELFVGSSIFLAFFMATDPATTPLTYLGQGIFGVGLGVLTVLIQTYMNFFGGSILALVIMNLTSPLLDKLGTLRPMETKKEPKLPKVKQFTTVKTTPCIRCGACMRVCCHKLSPILIKEAFDKNNMGRLTQLKAYLCEGCGHCSFVCPARIDLKGSILRAKSTLTSKQ